MIDEPSDRAAMDADPGAAEPADEAPPDTAATPDASASSAEAAPNGGPASAGPAPIELRPALLEALLFVAERPLHRREIAQLAGVDRATVDACLGDLEVDLAERGIRLVLDGDRVELATAPEAAPLVARYLGVDALRLSPAALETLAIVAYRQPITRAAIERIRGVDSSSALRSLLHRRLVVELGRADLPGRPFLYGTGFEFLERFGLTSLADLPPLEPDVAARLAEEGIAPVGVGPLDAADDGPDAATDDAAGA